MISKIIFAFKKFFFKSKTTYFFKEYCLNKSYFDSEFNIPFDYYGIANNERIIEIPWALSNAVRYIKEKSFGVDFLDKEYSQKDISDSKKVKILEIGYVRAWDYWIKLLKSLQEISEVHLTDIRSIDEVRAPKELFEGFVIHQDDIVNSNIEDKFHVIFLISTIEHFGKRDDLIRLPYASPPLYTDPSGFVEHKKDIDGLSKISELLAKDGIMLCSVPFGKLADYGSHIIYNRQRIELLKEKTGLEEVCSKFYYFKNGWTEVDESVLDEVLYQQNFAEAATGLGCFIFRKKIDIS